MTGLAIGLVGLAVVGWAVATSARFYNTGFSIGVFAISGAPFVAYVMWMRGFVTTLLIGIALLATTVLTYGSFGRVPASSRDGVEAMWILLGLALNLAFVALGALAERRSLEPSRKRHA